MTQKKDFEYWKNKIFPHGNYWIYPAVFVFLIATTWIACWANVGLIGSLSFLQYIGKATIQTGNEMPYVMWGILSNLFVSLEYFAAIFMGISMIFDARYERSIRRKKRGEL